MTKTTTVPAALVGAGPWMAVFFSENRGRISWTTAPIATFLLDDEGHIDALYADADGSVGRVMDEYYHGDCVVGFLPAAVSTGDFLDRFTAALHRARGVFLDRRAGRRRRPSAAYATTTDDNF